MDNADVRFDFVDEVDPMDLVGNAYLELHHHMAPAGGWVDTDWESEGVA